MEERSCSGGHAHGSAAPSQLWVRPVDSARDDPGYLPLEGGLAWEQAESGLGTAGSVLGFALERAEAGERKAMARPGRGKGRMNLGERAAPSPVRRELSCLGTCLGRRCPFALWQVVTP